MVLSHAPNLVWHLEKNGFYVIGPYSQEKFNRGLRSQYECIALLRTNIGVLSADQYERMYQSVDNIKYLSVQIKRYGRDNAFLIKRKLDKNYPEYSIELNTYYQATNLKGLNIWSANSENY